MLGKWGVTDAETGLPFACDALVGSPSLEAWPGVTIHAAPDHVWTWLTQMRVAPYSYDWIDNLGRRSPRTLLGLPEPQVGEACTATAGRKVGRIVAVDPGRELTGKIAGACTSYLLVPT